MGINERRNVVKPRGRKKRGHRSVSGKKKKKHRVNKNFLEKRRTEEPNSEGSQKNRHKKKISRGGGPERNHK